MRYMLTIVGDESGRADATPEDMQEEMGRWQAFTDDIRSSGVFIAGEGLAPSATAKTIRIGSNGDRTTTDGPFAETKEVLGGFYLIEVESIDEALEWGNKIPARGGMVEVRPVMNYDAAGVDDPAS